MLPREKYLEKGIDNLSDMDLIAILIGSGIKGKDFMSVSRSALYYMRKSLRSRGAISLNEIIKVDGTGPATGMRILSGIELGKRLYNLGDKERVIIKNSVDAYENLKDIGKKKQEFVIGLFLNSRFELLERRIICIGSFDGVNILPRDIIIPALELNASSIIMAHNHPSGDPSPSLEDISMTKNITDALELVGLHLLDHIIIATEGWKRVET